MRAGRDLPDRSEGRRHEYQIARPCSRAAWAQWALFTLTTGRPFPSFPLGARSVAPLRARKVSSVCTL